MGYYTDLDKTLLNPCVQIKICTLKCLLCLDINFQVLGACNNT